MAIDPLTAVMSVGEEVIKRIWPNPADRAEQMFKLEELRQAGDLKALELHVKLMTAQIETNKADSESGSWWQAGWRPFIGWTCGFIMFFNFIVIYCLEFSIAAFGLNIIVPQPMDLTELWPVILGMLGMSAFRSHDKKHKIDTK